MFNEKFWIAIAFILLIAILYSKISKIIANALEGKAQLVKSRLAQAKELKTQAEEIHQNCMKQKNISAKQAKEIIANAEKYASDIIKKEKESLKYLLAQKKAQTATALTDMERRAIEQIHDQAIEQAITKFKQKIGQNNIAESLYQDSLNSLKKAI